MPTIPAPPNKLEVDVAGILGLDLATIVAGSLVIDSDTHGGPPATARWQGAMDLTVEQVDAVEARFAEEDVARRASHARGLLAALPPEQRRQLLADFEEPNAR